MGSIEKLNERRRQVKSRKYILEDRRALAKKIPQPITHTVETAIGSLSQDKTSKYVVSSKLELERNELECQKEP